MASIVGAFTGWSGKVGNVVFTMWRGIQCVKTRTIPFNPQSAGQTANRTCMKNIQQRFKILAVNWIRPLWNPFRSDKQTGWGNFLKKNKLSMTNLFDISLASFSDGVLELVPDFSASYNSVTGLVSYLWNSAVFLNGSSSDFVHVLVYDSEKDAIVFYHLDTVTRALSGTSFNIGTGYTADKLSCFICLTDTASTNLSISLCSNSQVCIAVVP